VAQHRTSGNRAVICLSSLQPVNTTRYSRSHEYADSPFKVGSKAATRTVAAPWSWFFQNGLVFRIASSPSASKFLLRPVQIASRPLALSLYKLQRPRRNIALTSRMHSVTHDPLLVQPLIQSNREQDVCRLRLPICNPTIISIRGILCEHRRKRARILLLRRHVLACKIVV
jgi:hypothetical protein